MDDLTAQAVSFLEQTLNFETFQACVDLLLTTGWWQLLLCFTACSFLMITRLNAVEKNEFEGTLIGTLIMPYFSGFPNLGFLSGILMVVPNAFLAVYYAAAKRSAIAYSSQVGDCHICIPLCIGLFAIFSPITVPPSFELAIFILAGASAGHFLFTAFLGKLPRFAGIILAGLYAFFIYKEVI